MTLITHDHYHQAPVEIRAAGISREALKTFGAAIESALIVAKFRSEPPAKPPRQMKSDMREVLAALVLMALRDLKVDTLPKVTFGAAVLPECPACGTPATESWPFANSATSRSSDGSGSLSPRSSDAPNEEDTATTN